MTYVISKINSDFLLPVNTSFLMRAKNYWPARCSNSWTYFRHGRAPAFITALESYAHDRYYFSCALIIGNYILRNDIMRELFNVFLFAGKSTAP